MKGVSDENIKNKITQYLNENFPATKNKAINICFTEISEIDEENGDVTSRNLKQIVALASQVEKPITQRNIPLSEERFFPEKVFPLINESLKKEVIYLLKKKESEY